MRALNFYSILTRLTWTVILLCCHCHCLAIDSRYVLPLAGQWRFALDRKDVGLNEQWFNRDLADKIQLPGVLQAQGYGDEISTNTPWVLSLYDKFWFLREDYTNYTKPGQVKVPFLCQPPRHYLGAAWYQRDIDIPTNWTDRRVVLFLERPHWESRVWLDDKLIGTNDSLCVPHEFELGVVGVTRPTELTPGKHRLTVRVDNRLLMPYRPDAHSVSDSLAQSWNGIVGKMELRGTSPVWIEYLRVDTHPASKSVTVSGKIGSITGESGSDELQMFVTPDRLETKPRVFASAKLPVTWTTNGGSFEAGIALGEAAGLWDEFDPTIYRLKIWLGQHDAGGVHFGLRELKTAGTDFVINGRKTFLRGTHHGGDFPLTGYPPTDVEYWQKLFSTCKEWGLNHMRFHSFCPPEAAFMVADEVGIYLQIEPGMWNTFNPDSPMEDILYRETERILKAYGNHPSFVLFSPSNEPKGRWKDVLPKWAEHFRAIDPRHLYTTGTGFTDADAPGPLDRVDFTVTQRFGNRQVRGAAAWFGGDYSRSVEGVNVPVVTHEVGQWCAYPDFDVIKKFTGYMRPGNYEIFRDSAETHGLFGRAGSPLPADGAHGVTRPTNKDFAFASGRCQLACYKEEIEANLRTPGLAGFQLLDLHDYVGQGTALVGLLDPFWESKGYVTADEFRNFCSPTIPLARLKKRVFTTADRFEVPVEVANFGPVSWDDAWAGWRIENAAGDVAVKGTFAVTNIPTGRSIPLGNVFADLSKLPSPAAYKLVATAGSLVVDGPMCDNNWNFWLYPATNSADTSSDTLITSSWGEATAKLEAGGKVLFLPRKVDLDWSSPPLDTVPIFWNRLMNPGWSRMLGLWCDTGHPALAAFPTESNCDWQWTEIIRSMRAINLAGLPRGLQPVVSAIDDWNRNWKLGVIFEARVGQGRLVVSVIDVERNKSPVARQLRCSLLDYMAGEKFQPMTEISAAQFNSLHFDSRVMQKLGATAQAEGDGASAAIDGDPNTYWLVGTRGRGRDAPPPAARPHTLTITFTNSVLMNGLVLMNRQNDRDHIGDVRGFEVHASDDGTNWTRVADGELASTWNPQSVQFEKTITARQIRFTALAGFGNDTATSLAELAVIYSGPKLADAGNGDVDYKRSRSTSSDVDEGSMP